MTEIEWLASEEPAMMLRETPALSDRKARLLTVAIERHWWADTGDKSVAPALAVLESWAEGRLDEHSEGVRRYRQYYWWLDSDPHLALEESIRTHNIPADRVVGANLLREVVGNPWRQVVFWPREGWRVDPEGTVCLNPAILDWQDGTVPRLARTIYDGRLWAEMPILGDALEEAGCPDGDLLRHCRGQEQCPRCLGRGMVAIPPGIASLLEAEEEQEVKTVAGSWHVCPQCEEERWITLRSPHVRGCWALDIILGLD